MFLKLKYQKVFFKMTNSIIIMIKKNKIVFQFFLIILFLSSPISISSQNIQSRFLLRNDKSKQKVFNDSIAELNSKMFDVKTVLIPGFDNKGMEDWLELDLNDGEFLKNNFDDSSWDSWLPRNTSKESRNSDSFESVLEDFEAVLSHKNKIFSDGLIWLRTKIKLEDIESDYNMIIKEGIDDLDQTYFNGQLIGSTYGWDVARNYRIPKQILIKGENTIAIRAFDWVGHIPILFLGN